MRLLKKSIHFLTDAVMWQLKSVLPGSARGYSPKGKWLTRKDLSAHPEIDYREIFPESRIPFQSLILSPVDQAEVEKAAAEDDWTNWVRETFVAKINQGRMIGLDIVLSQRDDFFSGLRFPHVRLDNPEKIGVLRHPRYGSQKRLPGRALFLDCIDNLYHFIFEAVVRVVLAERAGYPLDSFDWFISKKPVAAFANEILRLLGVDQSKFVLPQGEFAHVQFDELVFTNTTYGISADLVACVRQRLDSILPAELPDTLYSRKIFLSRGSMYKARAIVNEPAVKEALLEQGFDVVVPHELSLGQQRYVFENAECIVSAHGAGLANLLWARPGTKVVEMRNRKHIRGYWKLYWNLGSVLDLNYHWLCCDEGARSASDRSGQYSDLVVPVEDLTKMTG
jgi:hypothetical protein